MHQLFTAEGSPPDAPVTFVDTGSAYDSGKEPQEGIGLCLSGGGYRAMLFHLGSLWRIYEADLMPRLRRVSSVSGGSITAAVLALKWRFLSLEGAAVRDDFVPKVVKPIRDLADKTLDAGSVLGGIFLPGTIADKLTKEYRKRLYGDATLQDLPDENAPAHSSEHGPRFVFNSTNVQSGALWRFARPYMGDYRVGLVNKPEVQLATVVAASSAFPPVLSPLQLDIDPSTVTRREGNDLHEKPYTKHVVLSDGGVYDNLGLETVWKRYTTVLVSDAGGAMSPEAEPKEDWARHSYRVLNLIDNQVRSLRKRQLIESYKAVGPHHRDGAYWGIRSNISKYGLGDSLPAPFERTLALADTPTRLKRMPDELQERLINWGYAVTDAALRKHYDASLRSPAGFPYPAAGV